MRKRPVAAGNGEGPGVGQAVAALRAADRNIGSAKQKARTFVRAFCLKLWCPGQDSVPQARPRLRLQAQPFSSSRKALKRFSSWAEMKKVCMRRPF
jgi:hypothetical protein